jgi:hypothetical protein
MKASLGPVQYGLEKHSICSVPTRDERSEKDTKTRRRIFLLR